MEKVTSVYEMGGLDERAIDVNCGVIERVKRNTLRWFGCAERIGDREFTQRMYERLAEEFGLRGKPLIKWENRMEDGT